MLKITRVPHIGLLLTSSCNLNCHNCADLIPYRSINMYAKDMAIQDLSKILNAVETIDEVLLIGGEVLLYKDLPEIVQYCINQEQIKKVILTTNGTILPKEELWSLLTNGKTVLRVSGYNTDVAPNRTILIQEAHRRGVCCEDLCCGSKEMKWKRISNNTKQHRNIETLQKIFNQCTMKFCITLNSEGILFFCSRQIAAHETEDYPKPFDYEILNVRNMPQEQLVYALHHFYSLSYISTCDYCDGINFQSTDIETAKQILPKSHYVQILINLFGIKNALHVEQQLKLTEEIVNILFLHKLTLAQHDGVGAFLNNIANLEYKADTPLDLFSKCLALVIALAPDYRIGVFDHNNSLLFGDSPTFNPKNYVKICTPKDNAIKADLTLDIDELEVIQTIINKRSWTTYKHE